MSLAAVILAAGQGTRMKSATPKVLHELAGRPLVAYSVDAATAVTGERPVLVVGHGADAVRAALAGRVEFAVQGEQLGTGHAVLQARELLAGQADAVLVSYGDMPLLTAGTLRALVAMRETTGATMVLLTVIAEDPRGFGRVVRGDDGGVRAVVEEVECTPEQAAITELNAGVYCFDAAWLWENLPHLPVSRKGEYYLTDAVAMAVAQGRQVRAVVCLDEEELLGINTRVHLAEAEQALRRRTNRQWMEAGVTMVDPATTYVAPTVTIGRDTLLLPGVHLRGTARVGERCRIGPNAVVEDAVIGDDCVVETAVVQRTAVANGSHVGPFRHVIGDGVRE